MSNLAISSVLVTQAGCEGPLVLLGLQAGPGLLHISDDVSRRSADLQLLQAAGETTGVAAERSVEVENFPLRVVQNDHVERSRRAADISSTAIRVLLGFEDVLD